MMCAACADDCIDDDNTTVLPDNTIRMVRSQTLDDDKTHSPT